MRSPAAVAALSALAALAAPLLLAGCPDVDGGIVGFTSTVGACTAEREKAHVLASALDWYLYQDLLPEDVDPAAYPTAEALLEALTAEARAQRQDRYWSYLTSLSQSRAFNSSGATAGFGLQFLQPDREVARIFVADVFEATPAAEAGFARGDEVLAVGEPGGALAPVADLLAIAGAFSQAIGPGTPGLTRVFEVRLPGGATEVRTMTKRAYELDPVAPHRIVDLPGGGQAGYVHLRTFIGPADAQLREAFAAFGAAGVTRVAIDLRYNGGGLVSTARTLGSLAGGGLAGQLMYRFALNDRHAAESWDDSFVPEAAAVETTRIAFITTGGSASASELVPNVLEPYREVALVGARTYGKPVGQIPFDLPACDLALYLISFRLQNAQGEGGYYDGLPDDGGQFTGPLCAAADDLAHPQGDPAEASTAAALHWLDTGACPVPAPAAAAARALRAAPGAATSPEAAAPSHEQRQLPGLF